MKTPALIFDWDGECLRPAAPYMARLADRHLTIGERYRMSAEEERSIASHNHYFAALHEAWCSLPEGVTRDFPSAEHLRHYALIATGYCDSQTFTCSSKAEAVRMAAFMEPIDPFSVVTAREATVTRFVARSQSMKAMGKQEFQQSKDRVLDFVAQMIGTDAQTLLRARAA